MARIADVAAAAGVTIGTVSRVLNNDPSVVVRPETRERIIRAAKAVNYTPNYAARALRRSRVGAVGLAVHDVRDPVFGEIITGAQRVATQQGTSVILADITSIAGDQGAFDRLVRSGLVDGLLMVPLGNDADRRLAFEASRHLPLVIVNDVIEGLSSVSFDNRAATCLATQHLLELGHRAVGFLALDDRSVRAEDRRQGWVDALREAGVPARADWVVTAGNTPAGGEAAVAELLSMPERPTAIVVASVMAAVGVLAAARRAGIEVPADLSVIAIHDLFFAAELTPGLTVVRTPLERLGEDSMSMVLDSARAPEPKHLVVTDPAPEVVVRESTTPLTR